MPGKKRDPTLGVQFSFPVLTKRWGVPDTYHLTRTAEGWDVDFMGISGHGDRGGRDALYESLDHDCVEYPASLPIRLEYLWRMAQDRCLSKRQTQAALTRLARWVSEVEYRCPKGPVWEGYK